jgi:hypothetical protein
MPFGFERTARGTFFPSSRPKRKKEHHGACAGPKRSPLYDLWNAMIQRCHNPRDARFELYGARGIVVCERWRVSFAAFLEDLGPRPSPGHSLERIDNEKGYESGNVRWATTKEQARNKRSNRFLTLNGVSLTIAEWAESAGMTRHQLGARLRSGWSLEEALATPVGSTGVGRPKKES